MTILSTWTPSSVINSNLIFLMKSQPVYRGVVIHHEGNYAGQPEFSSRRYSVIEYVSPNLQNLIIGSIYYHSHYDSENPYEPLVKYGTGEWKDLMVREFYGTPQEAFLWDGTSTSIYQESFHLDNQ